MNKKQELEYIAKYNIKKWETKPKRIWDALTGKYYTLPLIGAIGTREGLKND